ncbi:hypothetical protein AWE51_05460 [Aquimarina aggregata]|uniref:Uncharacterized protein n=1 Tax=Aquimarina aggregata TaxID=1642818 RepID=A0A163AAV6_9FLAO|nr:hypothetical protein [Aquimarina aggregata]KZS40401.1 hypothetical protein AWE51_05460 [Aquimarina aggregata]
MHENLKYTLRLDESIKEFRSFNAMNRNTIQSRAEIGDWQPIYSDIKYGTHYFLYGKFLGEKDGDDFIINKIQLYLQNYTGSVSIGFNGYVAMDIVDQMDENDPDNDPRYTYRKKYYLHIGLEGFKMESKTQNYPEDHTTPLNIRLKQGDILITNPFFTPAIPDISLIYDNKNRNESNFVDDLFMERMGEDVFITPEGEEALINLHLLDLISEESLLTAGIDDKKEPTKTKLLKAKAYREARGITFACRPENAFFQIN